MIIIYNNNDNNNNNNNGTSGSISSEWLFACSILTNLQCSKSGTSPEIRILMFKLYRGFCSNDFNRHGKML